MFDFFNKEAKEAAKAEKREKDFIRERDTFNTHHTDDNTYLATQDNKSDLIRWQQEFDAELDELFHELLSEKKVGGVWVPKTYKEYNIDKKIWITKDVSPLCSAEFAEKLIRIGVKPWLNKNAVNSNLTEKTIIKMLRNTHNDIVGAISDGWGIHGIKSLDDANHICRMLKNYVDPAAYRALNGWTKNTDSTMIKRIESSQESLQKQQNTGLLGLFKS